MAVSNLERGASAVALAVLFLTALPPDRLTAQLDPTGHWRTLDTPHFSVHARAEHRELALRAAGEAELAYAALARVLPAPRGRIDLVVADNADQANGYATTYPGNRIVVYAVPPAGDIELASYDRWLRLVVTHELAHVFHLDLARGWWGLARRVLGRAPFLFPNQYAPPWMREGLAVFYESRLTDAGRLEGAFHRALVTAAAVETGGLPLDRANTASPRWPAGQVPYAFGSSFLEAAADSAGDSAVARYARRTASPLMPWLQLSGAWRRETGRSLSAAWRDWQPALARDHAAAIADSSHRPSASGHPLVAGLRLAIPPRLSPDGGQLLLAHNDGRDATRLMVLDRRTGERRRLGWFFGISGIGWLPDGDAVVAQLDFTDRYTTRSDLWRVNLARRDDVTRLTSGARLREPDVAPDGAIVAVRVVPGGTELVLIDSTAPPRVIGASEPGLEWASPRFSPAGDRIAAVRVRNGWHDVSVRHRMGGPWFHVTRDSVPDLQPAFSTDGRWLMWSRVLDGVPQIVGLVDGDDSLATMSARFTSEPFAAWGPAPAGDSLFYLSYHADGFRLVSTPLTPLPWPLPAPDTTRRAFAPPPAELRAEHDYRPLRSLGPRYWIPQAFVPAGGGSWLGAFTSGNDALDRHAYTASLLLGAGPLRGEWQGVLGYAFAGPGHAVLDALFAHQPQLVDTSRAGAPAPVFCCASDDEAHLGVSLLRRRSRSQWQLRGGVEYTRAVHQRFGGSLSLSFGNPVAAPLGISTQGGNRVSASARFRRRLYQDRHSGEYVLRARSYRSFDGGQFARQVLAVRVAGATTSGNDRPSFSVGGASSGAFELLPGLSLGGAARTFQVRGYPAGYLSGPHAVGLSVEHRVPLALVARGLGLAPVGLDRLSAAAFADGGAAWSRRTCRAPPVAGGPAALCSRAIGSVGAELAADLVLGYSYALRLRLGGAARVSGDLAPGVYVAFGTAF